MRLLFQISLRPADDDKVSYTLCSRLFVMEKALEALMNEFWDVEMFNLKK